MSRWRWLNSDEDAPRVVRGVSLGLLILLAVIFGTASAVIVVVLLVELLD